MVTGDGQRATVASPGFRDRLNSPCKAYSLLQADLEYYAVAVGTAVGRCAVEIPL